MSKFIVAINSIHMKFRLVDTCLDKYTVNLRPIHTIQGLMRTISPKKIYLVPVALEGSTSWRNTLATALLHDRNRAIPFILIVQQKALRIKLFYFNNFMLKEILTGLTFQALINKVLLQENQGKKKS